MDELIDKNELAKRLMLSPETIRQWTYKGKLPCIRITRKIIRYHWETVVAWYRKKEFKGGHI